MSEGRRQQSIVRLGLFLGLSNLAHIAIGVTDVFMASVLGAVVLAAATLGATLFHVIVLLGVGFAAGIGPLLAKYEAAKETKKVTAIIGLSMLCMSGVLILGLFVVFYGEIFLRLVRQDANLAAQTQPYLNYLGYALPFSFGFSLLWVLASVRGEGKFLFWLSLVSIFVNAACNYLFMFGVGGLDAMGLKGLGLSTCATLVLKTIAMFSWLKFKGKIGGVCWDYQESQACFKEVLRYSIPMTLLECSTMGFFAVLTLIVGLLGAQALASHAITLQVAEIGTALSFGFSEAASIVIASLVGERNMKAVASIVRKAFVCGGGAMIAYGVFILFVNDVLVSFITLEEEPEIGWTLRGLLLIAAVCLIVDSSRIVGIGVLRGLGDTKAPVMITTIGFWLIAIPAAYILGVWNDIGVRGVWLSLALGMSFSSALLIYRIWSKLKSI